MAAYRSVPKVFWPAVAAFPLMIAQAVLGGIVVKTDLDPWWVTAHFAAALALVADVVYLAANSFCTVKLPEKAGPIAGSNPKFARLTVWTAVVTGTLLLVGTYVRARGAGLAFDDWPLMNGKLVPALEGVASAMFTHRVLAAAGFLLVLYTAVRAWTMAPRSKDLVVLSSTALGLFVVQIMVGAANVWSRLRPAAVVAHVALSVLIWATLVALATVSRRFAEHRPRTPGRRRAGVRRGCRRRPVVRSGRRPPRTSSSPSRASWSCCSSRRCRRWCSRPDGSRRAG